MNPKSRFENFEIMSRERATLAKKEAEHGRSEILACRSRGMEATQGIS